MFKITKIEIFTIVIILFAFTLYFYPRFALDKKTRQNALVKAHCENYVMAVLEFSTPEDAPDDMKIIAEKAMDKLNPINKNPVDRSRKAFTINENCAGCADITYDKKSITIKGYGADNEVLKEIKIEPPATITYGKVK